ncbi:alpha/beta fold hydrolase [Cohnella caldifontis]|uniref:alpha/beta fold hydrolase n=1 Tax=Cohnella caldifontis TaxID=3027471 RepID=UPI0023EB60A9|nr:alpha/beta hydrolase [Cohnella sp. YIM B05605]
MAIAIAGVATVLALGLIYEQVSRRRDARRPVPGKRIELDGYRLHMTDTGKDGPPVVLVHGAGDCSYSWIHVSKQVAPFARVIAYDRPGMGSSDPGPEPTPEQTVQVLDRLLDKAGVTGPVILAGHSLGGLIARLYAMEYPHKVAGLVFLDSTHEFLVRDAKFKQGFAAIGVALKIMRVLSPFGIPRFLGNAFGAIPMFGHERSYYKQQLSPDEYRQWKGIVYGMFARKAAEAEFNQVDAHLRAAENRMNAAPKPQFGDLPVAVVNNPGFGENWTKMQQELASRSTNHIHATSDRKGHSLQMPRPELVVNAIRHVVEQVRARGSRTLAERE